MNIVIKIHQPRKLEGSNFTSHAFAGKKKVYFLQSLTHKFNSPSFPLRLAVQIIILDLILFCEMRLDIFNTVTVLKYISQKYLLAKIVFRCKT